jgi:hypothetical protein
MRTGWENVLCFACLAHDKEIAEHGIQCITHDGNECCRTTDHMSARMRERRREWKAGAGREGKKKWGRKRVGRRKGDRSRTDDKRPAKSCSTQVKTLIEDIRAVLHGTQDGRVSFRKARGKVTLCVMVSQVSACGRYIFGMCGRF